MDLSWRMAMGLGVLALACSGPAGAQGGMEGNAEQAFAKLSRDFLETYLVESPVSATYLGDHRFDGRWPQVGEAADERQLAWLRGVQAQLAGIPRDQLSAEARVDAAILEDELAGQIFSIEKVRPWANNPLAVTYTVGPGLDYLVSHEFAPLPQRMASLQGRLETLPAFLEQARAATGTPPKIHTETAIAQNQGLIAFVDGSLRVSFAGVPEQSAALTAAADTAAAALREHQTWLEQELLLRSTADFRIGEELFAEKLGHSLDSDMSPDQVVAEAWTLLAATTDEMARLAHQIYSHNHPEGEMPVPTTDKEKASLIDLVLQEMAADHPSDDTVLPEAREALAEATAFVREHDLVTVPDEPVSVIEMPEFKRGVAIAYCDAPGPLEQSRETFYAIAPPPADWPAERRESFYREYNTAMMRELTIHEAMPGHFVQIAHANRFDSPVRAVFSSGTFVEGWALYSEWVMTEAGFGGPEVKMQRLKLVLRLCCNAILDHGIHAGSMTHEQALELMTRQGFQEEGEAEGKWTRACLTSTQLSTYLVGLLEVMAIRCAAEARAGDGFDVKAFHDELLAHGSPPPRHVRALLGLQ